jgi:hypothetical protein
LTQVVGTSKWQATDYRGQGETIYVSDFTLTRTRSWVRLQQILHYGTDTKITITTVKGWDKSQESTFKNTLEVGASANIFDVLHADVKNTLEITEGTRESWHEEKTTQEERTYKAGVTYLQWQLIDTYHLDKIKSVTGTFWSTHIIERASSTLNVVIGFYEDDYDGDHANTKAVVVVT